MASVLERAKREKRESDFLSKNLSEVTAKGCAYNDTICKIYGDILPLKQKTEKLTQKFTKLFEKEKELGQTQQITQDKLQKVISKKDDTDFGGEETRATKELAAAEQRLATGKEKLRGLQEKKTASDNKKVELANILSVASDRNSKLVEELKTTAETFEKDLAIKKTALQKKIAANLQLEEELIESRANVKILNQIDKAKNDINEVKKEIETSNSKVDGLKVDIDTTSRAIDSIKTQFDSVSEEKSELDELIKTNKELEGM